MGREARAAGTTPPDLTAGTESSVQRLGLGRSFGAEQVTVTLARGEREMERDLINFGLKEVGRRMREQHLDAAVSAGKITAAQKPEWRQRWTQDATAASRALGQLPAGAARSSSPSRAPRTAASSTAARSSRLSTDEATGQLVYAGRFPVRMAGGEPAVFTADGWMHVAAFEAAGLGEDVLDEMMAAVQVLPDGPTGRAFHEGPRS